MDYKGPRGITILEGLEPVRRLPAMYIGGEDVHPSPRVRLLEYAVSEIAHERIAERLGRKVEDVRIGVEDRMTEDADWY